VGPRPHLLMMRRFIFILGLVISFSSNAKENGQVTESVPLTSLQVHSLFKEENLTIDVLPDLVEKEEKITTCVEEYIKKQSKSYAKMAQDNLYNLIHNFDRVASIIYGKKVLPDDIPLDEKIEALARVQCNAYYTMGVLK